MVASLEEWGDFERHWSRGWRGDAKRGFLNGSGYEVGGDGGKSKWEEKNIAFSPRDD